MADWLRQTLFTLLTSWIVYKLYQYKFDTPTVIVAKELNLTYDYVVVGAGSTGCVVANRLSEDPDITVLLLESGGNDIGDYIFDIPGYTDKAVMSHADWKYYTVPQKKAAQAFKDHRSFWPRGRTLGGSSTINSLVYMRGGRGDYDKWAELGATGWDYDSVLPYFLKSEALIGSDYSNSVYHNTDGPMKITEESMTPIANIFLEAGKQIGYKVHDCNGNDGDQEGFCKLQAFIGDGLRSSTARSFLIDASKRNNLHVSIDSHVTKINIENKRATGVQFIRKGRKMSVTAKREIIVSAGAVGSPQVLLLSGVGPAKHLKEMGIPVKADLPVGDNLQDHLMFPMMIDIDKPYTSSDWIYGWWPQLQYFLFRSGYLSLPGMREAAAFFRTDPTSKDPSPDVQFQLHSIDITYSKRFAFLQLHKSGAKDELEREVSAQKEKATRFTVGVMAPQHPKSTGTIRLASTDPFDYPLIDPQYLQHEDDLKSLIRGIRKVEEIVASRAMKGVGAKLTEMHYKECETHTLGTDKYWECLVHQLALTNYHPSCTCKMGAKEDKTTVVGPDLKVKGIEGLRVADASVMPFVTAANTNAPVIMIGEKVADMIRNIDSVKKFRKSK